MKQSQHFNGSALGPRLVDESISKWIVGSSDSVPSLTEDYSRSSESVTMSELLLDQDELSWNAPELHESSKPNFWTVGLASMEAEIKCELSSYEVKEMKGAETRVMTRSKTPLPPETSPSKDASIGVDFQMSSVTSAASDRESTDSESAWMSDYSRGISLLEKGHPLLKIKSIVVRDGLLGYQNSKQRMHGRSEDKVTQGTPYATKEDQVTPTQRKRNRGKGGDGEDARGSEDDDVPLAKRPRTSKRASGPNVLFACPFAKKDPLKYRSCYSYVLKRIRDVKQHLSRFHQLPMYCPRCMSIFEAEEERDEHIRASSCLVQDTIIYEGVTRAQKILLGQRTSSKMTLSDQWFTIFDILFPGHNPRPKSAYMNIELTVELEGFQDLMYADGPRIISSAIRSSGIQISTLEDREGDSLALLEMAIEDGLRQIAQRWSANIPNTLPDSMSSQVTATEESSSPNTSYNVGNPGASPSSSNTLVERSPEARSGSRRGLQLANQDYDPDGDDENTQQIATGLQRAAQTRDDLNLDPDYFGSPTHLLALSTSPNASNADQRYPEPSFDDSLGDGSDLLGVFNQVDFFDFSGYGTADGAPHTLDDSLGCHPQFDGRRDL